MGVKTRTIRIDGGTTAVKVALEDGHRRHLSLYAQSGSCVISIGSGSHTDGALVIAQGNILSTELPFASEIWYSGDGTSLLVITDRDRTSILTYHNLVLTYNEIVLTYQSADYVRYLSPPVFK